MSSHIPADLVRAVRQRANNICEYCRLPQDLQPFLSRTVMWYTQYVATAPETSALDRVLDHLADCFTPESAKRVAELRASADLQARLDELGDKCNEGQLTPEERAEYETYVHAIDFISILQSKARQFLAKNLSA